MNRDSDRVTMVEDPAGGDHPRGGRCDGAAIGYERVQTAVAPSYRLVLTRLRGSIEAVAARWGRRRERLWLGLVAVPLAELATGLLGAWWAWPLLLAAAWAVTPSWRWYWMLSLELGVLGVMWATVGIEVLGRYPDARLMVGAAWAAFPLALTGTGTMSRRRARRPEAYFPLD
jgi:hypothetical protein